MGIPFAESDVYPKVGHNSYPVANYFIFSNSFIFLLLSLIGSTAPKVIEIGKQIKKPIPNFIGSFKMIK